MLIKGNEKIFLRGIESPLAVTDISGARTMKPAAGTTLPVSDIRGQDFDLMAFSVSGVTTAQADFYDLPGPGSVLIANTNLATCLLQGFCARDCSKPLELEMIYSYFIPSVDHASLRCFLGFGQLGAAEYNAANVPPVADGPYMMFAMNAAANVVKCIIGDGTNAASFSTTINIEDAVPRGYKINATGLGKVSFYIDDVLQKTFDIANGDPVPYDANVGSLVYTTFCLQALATALQSAVWGGLRVVGPSIAY